MPDRDQGARTGNKKGSDKDAGSTPSGVIGDIKRSVESLLREGLSDTIFEMAGDVEIRDRAEQFGMSVAEEMWKNPAQRKLLEAMPNWSLRLGAPLVTQFVVRYLVQDLDRVVEWGREFSQGWARRVRELKTEAPAPVAAAEMEKHKGPSGPPEMSAAEVLAKRPALQQRIDRLPPELRARVYASLNFEHEADALSVPSGLTPFDALIGVSPHYTRAVQVVELAPIEERPGLYALLRARVGSVTQLNDVLMPPPAAAVTFEPLAAVIGELTRLYPNQVALDAVVVRLRPHLAHADRMAFLFPTLVGAGLTAQMLEQHLVTLEAMIAATPAASILPDWSLLKQRAMQLPERLVDIPDEIIAQRLVLIEDARADRHTNNVVKDAMKVVHATTRKLFGDEAHLVQNVQVTTAAVDNLRDRLFGPRPQPGQGVWSFIRSLFARLRAAGAAALAAYRASRAANAAPALPPPNNPPNP